MIKKIIYTFFVYIFLFFIKSSLFAASIPVEKIFSDIDSNYKYYNELQYLYDKWMIFPDESWRFNPNKLLDRDEFVWIMMEVSCEKCISPNTPYNLINKYWDKDSLFFDVNKNNKYFYCISEAEKSWYVKWYQPWTSCENWVNKENEAPFCPNNTIILEEAIAVILRASWILTNQEADLIRSRIFAWEIKEDLSEDIKPFNLDWSVYSFYPDFQKAISYEVLEYDNFWNQNVYKLVEKIDNKIRPKQAVTKEKFLTIAYVALKANSCNIKQESNLWLAINIYDKSCSLSNIWTCKLSDLWLNEKVYDFYANVWLTPWDSITNPNSYIWRFYNYNTWEEIKKYWEFIDNYDFLEDWKYRVYLRVITDNWNTSEVYTDINIWNQNNLNIGDILNTKINISANPISWEWPLLVDFKSIVSDRSNIKSYNWDFWDWNFSYWVNASHIYREPWVYEVKLLVIDSWNNIYYSTLVINVYDYNNNLLDSDWDWVPDSEDLCPLIPWTIENKWCPVFEDICNNNEDCKDWFFCNSWSCSPNPFAVWCEYNWGDLIYWNSICNSCPCNNYVDFNSVLRSCDIIFPAITSPDQSTIYSKWNYFQVR